MLITKLDEETEYDNDLGGGDWTDNGLVYDYCILYAVRN